MRRHLASHITLRRDPATGLECCPSLDEASRLPPETLDAIHAYLDEQLGAHLEAQPPEGTEHSGAISEIQDRLRGHFQRLGRGVFIAPNLGVHYPDAPAFAPDLLAVVDVALHHRSCWRVDVEHRGIDFALEVVVDGDANKDLRRNVGFYASLGIPEYMVYQVRDKALHGWRLESSSAERYTRIMPQFGRLPSRILGLEFGVAEGRLRCWRDGAELPSTLETLELLGRMVDERTAVTDVLLDRIAGTSERATAEADRATAESERATAEAERRRAALRRSILRTLHLRGLDVTDAQRALVERWYAFDDPRQDQT
jgi:Uma2 family endonuclease